MDKNILDDELLDILEQSKDEYAVELCKRYKELEQERAHWHYESVMKEKKIIRLQSNNDTMNNMLQDVDQMEKKLIWLYLLCFAFGGFISYIIFK